MTEPVQQNPEPNQSPNSHTFAEYEELKKRNRHRLFGAAAITLVVCGLLLAISGNDDTANSTDANVASEVSNPIATTTPNTAQPVLAQPAASDNMANIMVETASDVPPNTSSEPMIAANNTNSEAATAQPTLTEQPALSNAEKRQLAQQQREQQQHEKAAQLQARQQARANAERTAEQKRREAQAVNARLAAEQAQRQQLAAERARQAKLAAEQKRQADRAQRLARQQAQQKQAQIAQQNARNQKQPAPAANTPTNTGNGRIMVQVGAYSTQSMAQQKQNQLKNMGYGTQIEPVQTTKGTMYRVRATGFANRASAEQAANTLKSRGFGGMIIEPKP